MNDFFKHLKLAARYLLIGIVIVLTLYTTVLVIAGDTKNVVSRLKSSYELYLTFFKTAPQHEITSVREVGCSEKETLRKAKQCTLLIGNSEQHGSGFVIKPGGWLVTNYHVISGSKDGFSDVLYNGIEYKARIAGFSEKDDIAVLRIDEAQNFCEWANPENDTLAETVYAVGWPNSPYGDSTITKGIISRETTLNEDIKVYQTDTPINPGNSGGPLVNSCGVIGINTAKTSWINQNEPSEGIGYAITAKHAISIVEKIIAEDNGTAVIPPEKITEQTTETPENRKNLNPNTLVSYDYEQVIFWEQRKIQDAEVLKSWENVDSEFVPSDKLNKLQKLLARNLEIDEILWDGYTNSKITYMQVYDNKQEYLRNSSNIEQLVDELNIEGSINAYKYCIDSWNDLEKEYNDDFSEQKEDCKRFVEY